MRLRMFTAGALLALGPLLIVLSGLVEIATVDWLDDLFFRPFVPWVLGAAGMVSLFAGIGMVSDQLQRDRWAGATRGRGARR